MAIEEQTDTRTYINDKREKDCMDTREVAFQDIIKVHH